MARNFKGIFVILATPFDKSWQIDFDSLRSLVEFELKAGVHGITILGVLGEVMRISESERQEITKFIVEQVNGRVPVIVGTGATGTELAKRYSKEAEDLGADGIMIGPPRLAKPNDDAVVKYYGDIANEVDLPIVVQDEPVTYGLYMAPNFIARLSEIEGVEYVKLEDPPTPIKISQIRNLTGDKLGLFGALGGLYGYEELSRGACGIMSGFAYPEILVRIYEDFSNGRHESARNMFYRTLPLLRYEAQPGINLAIRKELLMRRGAIKHSILREPAPKLDPESLAEIDELISALDIHNLIAPRAR